MIAVKGKKEAVTIYTLLGDEHLKKVLNSKIRAKHKIILENYFSQKWEKCINDMKFAKTLCNNLMSEYYDIMTDRINEFKENPLPADWDGVYVATSK